MNIKELAKQAGELVSLHDGSFALFGNKTIERFAELVAATERKECAKLCDEMGVLDALDGEKVGSENLLRAVGKQADLCAAAIRARGEK